MKILLLLVASTCIGACNKLDKFLTTNVSTIGIDHTNDTVLFNRAYNYSLNNIHESTTVLATDSIVYFILNDGFTEFHDSASYRKNPIDPYAKGAYKYLYYDRIQDTAYVNHHGLCFVQAFSIADSMYFNYPLTDSLFR